MVPDTIDGRFDLLILFSIILTFFLIRIGEKGKELSQVLFDKIFRFGFISQRNGSR